MSQAPVDDLLALLDLEPIEQNLFRGQSPDEKRQRVFGGQVAGQALVAATRTVDNGLVHSLHAHKEQLGEWYTRPRPIDTRVVPSSDGDLEHFIWMRADGVLPDEFVVHQCVLTYASDMTLLDNVIRPHGLTFMDGTMMMASLDHAMWFHRPFRADEWFLYAQDTPTAFGARGLARGQIYQNGDLVVSVVQEGLVRELLR